MARDRKAYNAYLNEYMQKRYYKRKAWAQELLGGKCVECGATDNLEFDHIDPETKSFTIGRKLVSVAQATLEAEIAKCQLLCYNCHKVKTYGAVV